MSRRWVSKCTAAWGFIEETGAAQFYRDARILPIYEGTTAIQANDLVGRKTARDGGAIAKGLISQIQSTLASLELEKSGDLAAMRNQLAASVKAFEAVVNYVVANAKQDIKGVFAGSVLYLRMAGMVLSAWQMVRSAQIAQKHLTDGSPDPSFYSAKIATARFYCDHILPQATALETSICEGSAGVLAMTPEQF